MLGAGDAFASGFLYGYLQGWPLERAARMGNALRRDRRHPPRLRQLHADARRSRRVRRGARGGGDMTTRVSSPPDDGAGGGAVSVAAAHRRATAASSRSWRRASASSVTATSPASARRCRSSAASLRYYLARNEQAMVHTAAAFAKMHNRLRTLACTTSIGPGRDQHDHRRRGRDDQPRAGAAAAGRHLRRPAARAGAAAARVEPVAGRVGQRLLQAGVALLGSDQPAGADRDRAARGDARADVAGRNRCGDAGAAAGRAGGGLRLPRRAVRAARLDDRRGRAPIAIACRRRRR